MKLSTIKGQISIPITLVGSILGSVLIGGASYYGSINGQAAAVAAVDVKVEVLKAKQEYTDERLARIETKIDALLNNRGINPNSLSVAMKNI